MANPQPTDAHLRIAHKISEQLMVSHFTEQQRRILDLILRLSWGCGKKEAIIPHQGDFEIVGVLKGHVKSHLDWLQEAKVIFRNSDTYSFNKDFDQWRVSRALAYTPRKLTELVTLNLNHTKNKLQNKEQVSYGISNKAVTEKGTAKNTENEAKNKVSRKNMDKLALFERNKAVTEKGTPPDTNLAMPKERLKKVLKKGIYIVPEWIKKEIWEDFLEMRKKKRTVPTERAKELLIGELEKLKREGYDPNEVLNQSIMRNYTGVFPLKGGQGGAHRGNPRSIPRQYTDPEDL